MAGRLPSKLQRTPPGRRDIWAAGSGWRPGAPTRRPAGLVPPASARACQRRCSRSSWLLSLLALALSQVANAFEPELPALRDAVAVLGKDQADGPVLEFETCHVSFGFEAVLQMVGRGVRHHQRPADLQQRRRLD